MLPAPDAGDRSALLSHVREHAPHWYPDLGSTPVVTLVVRSRRSRSWSYVVRVAAGNEERLVMIKVGDPARVPPSEADIAASPWGARPHLSASIDPAVVPGLQYQGLVITHEHFTALGDPRFGTVRPLDSLPDQRAVIMEYVEQPTLREAVRRGSRLGFRAGTDLRPAFANAGAWLREYQALRPASAMAAPVHRPERGDFASALRRFADYLAATGDAVYINGLADRAGRAAEAILPVVLPAGLDHGDYAARNLFVDPGQRITGFDGLPRWRVPIYEDMGRLVLGLRTLGFHILTMGMAYPRARLEAYEDAFLRGYFGDEPVPRAAVQLYELVILLDRWSALRARSRVRQLRHRIEMAVRMVVFDRFYRREADRLLAAVTQAQ